MASDKEMDDLVALGGQTINSMIDAYEPYEAAYTTATASTDVEQQASSTSSLPRSLIVNSSTAR